MNYIEGKNSEAFDHDAIKKFINDNKFWLVITPYTLYESIQSCVTEDLLKQRGLQMLDIWDFWVLNINGIIGKNSFEFGPNLVFNLNVGVGTTNDFVAKRSGLREKVFQSLVPRITLIAQLIAVVYLLITEHDEYDNYPLGFDYRIKLISGKYFQNEPNFKVQLYSKLQHPDYMGLTVRDGTLVKTWDFKEKLNEFIQDFVIQIIAVSKVITNEKLNNENLDLGELNNRIFREYYTTVGQYERAKMVKLYKVFTKKTKHVVTIENIVDKAIPDGDAIFNHLFKKVIGNWFLPSGQGKTLVNTIIDYVNLGVVEKFGKAPVIYMTEDSPFVDLALNTDDACFNLTRLFYKKYYKKR